MLPLYGIFFEPFILISRMILAIECLPLPHPQLLTCSPCKSLGTSYLVKHNICRTSLSLNLVSLIGFPQEKLRISSKQFFLASTGLSMTCQHCRGLPLHKGIIIFFTESRPLHPPSLPQVQWEPFWHCMGGGKMGLLL